MASAVQNWGEIIRTQNLASLDDMDTVSRWLLITRASVFPMTITSALIGGLLAANAPGDKSWGAFALAFAGLVIAHAANNMINDYFDLEGGVDTKDYVRGQYAPHPVLNGLISKGGLLTAIAIFNLLDLAILVKLTQWCGWETAAFALLGLFISVFYVAPPLKLKHRGLGEPGVAVVWGPLMIGGVYFVTAGELSAPVIAASLPYAVLVTSVLMGKHVDKYEADTAKGIRTLPVILGRQRALHFTEALFIGFFVLVPVLVLSGTLGVWTLLIFGAIPALRRTLKTYEEPRPESAPEGYPLWPLWYVAWAFLVTRRAGLLLIVGLALNVIWPLHLR